MKHFGPDERSHCDGLRQRRQARRRETRTFWNSSEIETENSETEKSGFEESSVEEACRVAIGQCLGQSERRRRTDKGKGKDAGIRWRDLTGKTQSDEKRDGFLLIMK